MKTQDCPNDETLENLLLGRRTALDRNILEQHVLECDSCAKRADEISPSDRVLQSIKDSNLVETQFEGMHELIERGRQVFKDTHDVAISETASFSDTHSVGSVLEELGQTSFAFLGPPQEPDEIGRFGPYRILGVLGKGGMGVVFLAEEITLRRQVALKVIAPNAVADDKAQHRFLREARAMAAVVSDHIVSIHQVGDVDSIPYLEMPVLQGESLKTRLQRETRLSFIEVCKLAEETAAGLAAAHERGLIHRDIKPDNIWLEESTSRIKILDFGLARCDDDPELTRLGTVVGTPRYMSPEQAEGKMVDHRSDLFSLGSVLYHCATWQVPFPGDSTRSTLDAVVQANPKPIKEVCGGIPEKLANLIMELLSKDPSDRPEATIEVAKRFREIRQQLTQDASNETEISSPLPVRKKTSKHVVIAIGTIALLGFVLWLANILIFKTPDGTIYVEFDSGNKPFTINVLADDTLVLQDPKDGKDIRVSIDRGHNLLRMEKNGFEAVIKSFNLTNSDGRKISVRFEPPLEVLAGAKAKDAVASGFDLIKDQPFDAAREREIANWIISNGGNIESIPKDSGGQIRISDMNSLPQFDFYIRSIDLGSEVTGEELRTLSKCKNLEAISLIGCWRIKANDLQHLANISGLNTLSVDSTQQSVPFMNQLARIPRLESLKIDGKPNLDNLVTLSQLVSLDLSGNDLSDLDLTSLSKMTRLKQLQIAETGLTVEQAREICNSLADCNVESDYSAEQILLPETSAARNREIASWVIRRGGKVHFGQTAIEDPQDLLKIDVFSQVTFSQIKNLRDEELKIFSGWSGVASFSFSGSQITGDGFKHLAEIDVGALIFQECDNLRADSFHSLVGSPHLESLLFSTSNAGDELATMASTLPNLKTLHLGANATGESIRILADSQSKQFSWLQIWGCEQITADDFEGLKRLSTVNSLTLSQDQLSLPFFEQLVKAQQIKSLLISSEQPLTKATLENVAKLDQISALDLSYNKLVNIDLAPLARMESLEKLSIRNTGLSLSAIDMLRETLPNCDITTE